MAKRAWQDLNLRTQRFIIVAGLLDGMLKAIALADLVRQPPGRVRGSKLAWSGAIVLVNSAGVVPVLYLRWGKRR